MARHRGGHETAKQSSSRKLEALSLLVAGLSLATAVGFNALQVRDSTKQAKLTREISQINLLTTVSSRLATARNRGTNSARALNLLAAKVRIDREDPLDQAIGDELWAAEYYAYLLRRKLLDFPGVPTFKGALVCTYVRALALLPEYDADYIARSSDLPNLRAWKRDHPGRYVCLHG